MSKPWFYKIQAYWQYMNSPKGRYEWRSYGVAILLWIVLSILAMRIIGSL